MIRFLIELLVRRTWFGQLDKLYFVLNWLVIRCKFRPNFGPNLRQTHSRQHDQKCRLKSIYFNHASQGNLTNYYLILGPPRQGGASHKSTNKFPPKRVKNLVTPSSIFISSSSTGELCSQPIRGNVHRTGRMFPEHAERSFLDPEYSFIAVRRILPTSFVKKFAQLRTN